MSSPCPDSPLRCAIVGMGGFAAFHHRALLRLEEQGVLRLVATCEPDPGRFPEQIREWRFAERRVRVFSSYENLLATLSASLDLVVISTPIPLHARMHRLAVEHGVPVYLEKPPTLDPAELDSMIACDRRARKATLVGFNFMAEEPRRALKARLLAGEFGRLREVRLLGLRARSTAYFRRNDWAGRLRTDDGRLLLDSCLGNATAHYVHNLLHWAGVAGLDDWAAPVSVRAELYRAHAIEGADTFFVEARTDRGVTARLALSHACHDREDVCETLVAEHARIDYEIGAGHTVFWNDGRVEKTILPTMDLQDQLVALHTLHAAFLRGESGRPRTTLADCRPFVHLNGLAYVASGGISDFPSEAVAEIHDRRDGQDYLDVRGLADTARDFLQPGTWPRALAGRSRHHQPKPATAAEIERIRPTVSAILDELAMPSPGQAVIRQ